MTSQNLLGHFIAQRANCICIDLFSKKNPSFTFYNSVPITCLSFWCSYNYDILNWMILSIIVKIRYLDTLLNNKWNLNSYYFWLPSDFTHHEKRVVPDFSANYTVQYLQTLFKIATNPCTKWSSEYIIFILLIAKIFWNHHDFNLFAS